MNLTLGQETSFTCDQGVRVDSSGVTYTVWAAERSEVSVQVRGRQGESRSLPLQPLKGGYFRVHDPLGQPGDLYTYTIDRNGGIPDFVSAFQPQGVFGPSEVIDPSAYVWQAESWKRPAWGDQVIYELHVGTFTPEGTYLAAIGKLDYLRNLGITAVELMPVAAWAGERNWGYDGVMLFAPSATYGRPEDLRALVDACHLRGLAILLDVVFNHLGPVGNHSHRFSEFYFHQDKHTPWGQNYDLEGPRSAPVRALLLQNLHTWLDDFRFDGFRMDATHAVHDESPRHLLVEAAELVHAAGGFIIAEDERNAAEILQPAEKGGWGFDAVWADDFCHSLRTSQTHHDEIFRDSFRGTPEELARIVREGWLYQGQVFPKTGKPRGTVPGRFTPDRFIFCLTNHDQAGNRFFGEYLHQLISPERYRAASLFFLLCPGTPLLFMGQEWGANSPFLYFTDLPGELGTKIGTYRKQELAQLYWNAAAETVAAMPDPQLPSTFHNSKLNWNETTHPDHQALLDLYREGLNWRRKLLGPDQPGRKNWSVESTENSIALLYTLPEKKIQVLFQMEPSASAQASEGRLLLSSRSPSLSEETREEPETRVLEISS